MELNVTVLQQTPKTSAKSGKNYTEFVVQDMASQQQIKANTFLPFDARLNGQQIVIELVQRGQYYNINGIKAPHLGIDTATQPAQPQMQPMQPALGQPAPQATPLGQPAQAPMQSNIPAQGQPMPAPAQPLPTPAQATNAMAGQTLSRKDINMSRMSAMRGACEIVGGLLPTLAASGVTLDKEKVIELVYAYADEALSYIVENKLPEEKLPF